MYKQIVLVLCVLITAATALTGWRNCGSNMATLHAVRMTNCTQTPCRFVRGNNYEAELDGTWRANSNSLPLVLSVVIFGIPINILEGDACDYKTRGNCPALNNADFTFRSYYPIPENLPAVSTVARGTILNDFGDVAVCLEIDVTLV